MLDLLEFFSSHSLKKYHSLTIVIFPQILLELEPSSPRFLYTTLPDAMGLSVEAIVAIIALFVALIQPSCTLWRYMSKRNSQQGMSKLFVIVSPRSENMVPTKSDIKVSHWSPLNPVSFLLVHVLNIFSLISPLLPFLFSVHWLTSYSYRDHTHADHRKHIPAHATRPRTAAP